MLPFAMERALIKEQFDSLDKNVDGVLNYKEFSALLKECGSKLSYKELLKLFHDADTDGDGIICFHEFVDYLRSEIADDASDTLPASPGASASASASASSLLASLAAHASSDSNGSKDSNGEDLKDASGKLVLMKPTSSLESRAAFSDLAGGADICRIELVEKRGITLAQIQAIFTHVSNRCSTEGWVDLSTVSPTYGQELDQQTINLYQVVDWVVKPATEKDGCSFVEFVTVCPDDQQPRWFVSHWWGEPLAGFIACIARHANDRELGEHSPYWVCAYANNQWDVEGELGADPAESSFNKAMVAAEGTVSVVDPGAVCYSRVWCCYEVWLSLTLSVTRGWPFRYDLYTTTCDGEAVGITDGLAPVDMQSDDEYAWANNKVERESTFPLAVASELLNVRLQDARASRDEDRVRILNSITGAADIDTDLPPAEHECYDELNGTLSGRFAVAVWCTALQAREPMTAYGDALAASSIRRLHLALNNCSEFSDKAATLLGANLPGTLQELHLDFTDTSITNTDGLGQGLERLRGLTELKLCFTRCMRLRSVSGLGIGLEQLGALRSLSMWFSSCERLTSIEELGSGIAAASNLTSLMLNFRMCSRIQSVDELGEGIGQLVGLRSLTLYFGGCMEIPSIYQLGQGLAGLTELTSFIISVNGCVMLEDVDELGRGLMTNDLMTKLHVYVDNCEKVASIKEIVRSIGAMRALTSLELFFSNTSVESVEDMLVPLHERDFDNFRLNAQACKSLPEDLQLKFESRRTFVQKVKEAYS